MIFNKQACAFTLLIGILYFNFFHPSFVRAHTSSIVLTTAAIEKNNNIPFNWIVVILGGIIVVTLSYVSWRKYKGLEKKQESEHKEKSNS
ncbi:sporulation protein YpjB [Virgibacillus sp. W0430]|uniref:sporulation protein YpjB n=1 Tax=Virgibacillus sp. W0430 TaxID=3391580 RepID=UPI003F45F00D